MNGIGLTADERRAAVRTALAVVDVIREAKGGEKRPFRLFVLGLAALLLGDEAAFSVAPEPAGEDAAR
jgi:hypothetical protein